MTAKIRRSIILIALISTFMAAFLTAWIMNYSFNSQLDTELRHETELIGRGVETGGTAYFDQTELHGLHVTLISRDGKVLYDSEGDISPDNEALDSDEVYEASKNGQGSTSVKLTSIGKKTISQAIKLRDGSILRTSDVHPSFAAKVALLANPLLLFFILVTLISVLAANMLSRRILRPINAIDPDDPVPGSSYPEIMPLIEKLHDQKGRITRQMSELMNSRDQFSMITESMDEGLIIADPKLNILACNSASARLLGSEPPTAGQSIYVINNSDLFRRCIQNAAGGMNAQCVLTTGNGDREIIASPAKSTAAVNGIVVFIIDITEKNKLETMRREFTSNVSHELKTPLTTIYGISDMLANGIVKQDDVKGFGENIRSEAERLITLINDIVSLSKLDEDSFPREDENVDIYELAAEALGRLRLSAAERSVTTHLTGESVMFFGNRTILGEVIFNLCDNAIKYNREGGAVEVKVSHAPQKVFITVSDTGIGIPKKHLSRIFERFYRVDKSRSRKIKGTGLGLSIVKHGVSYHNGTVRAESTEGKGTVFTVELPILPHDQ